MPKKTRICTLSTGEQLALLATSAIATTAFLVAIGFTSPTNAQECIQNGGLEVCLNNGSLLNNRQRERRSLYDKINKIYREVLERDADELELRTCYRELERRRSLRDIRHDIAKSREAQDAINRIYLEVLGQVADRKNLELWTKHLGRGRTMREVRQEIERIAQAQNTPGYTWR
ncbi:MULTISPECIES: hypothetical protein [Aerosakkonema]|uniref:hypothetical protein n=1 Tax=Aerosakkonema TaxID=1246629 RepID=UPI0035B8C8E0